MKLSMRKTMEPNAPVQDVDMLKWLTSDYYKKTVEGVRAAKTKENRDALKRGLHAVTPHGTFTESLKNVNLVQHSGFIFVDVDDKDGILTPEDLQDIKASICSKPYTFFCCLSASGSGLHAFIRIPAITSYKSDRDEWLSEVNRAHLRAFNWVEHIFATDKDLLIEIDTSCKNLSRIKYASYDAEYYLNEEASPIEISDVPKKDPIIYTKSSVAVSKGSASLSNYVKKSLEGIGFTNGSRHHSLVQVARLCRDSFGASEQDTESELLNYTQSDLPAYEIRGIVKHAFNRSDLNTAGYQETLVKTPVEVFVDTNPVVATLTGELDLDLDKATITSSTEKEWNAKKNTCSNPDFWAENEETDINKIMDAALHKVVDLPF